MDFIRSERLGNVMRITLHRPDRFNSFNRQMALELQQVLDQVGQDESVRAVLLTAEGKAFCAGQDLNEAIAPDGPGISTIVREHYNPLILRLRSLEKPVICAVNGVAAGAGANLAFACDIVLAASSATFIQAFSKIGLVPDSGGTYYLPRLIGPHRALALMMTGDKITADEAMSFGLVYKVYEAGQLESEALGLATRLSEMPTKGIAYTKKLVNESFENDLVKQLSREEEFQAMAGETYDYQEGVRAFVEKRSPVFKGA